MNVKMNLRIITNNNAANPEKGFLTASISRPYGRTRVITTAWKLTDTGEDSNLSTGENVKTWKRYFLLFFQTRFESAPSRKYSCRLLDVFACIG